MVGRKRHAPVTGNPRTTRSQVGSAHNPAAIPSVYREMVREARRARTSSSPERPRKRQKRPGERAPKPVAKVETKGGDDDDDDEDGIEFEDVVIPTARLQTVFREDSDEEGDDDILFEGVDVDPGGSTSAVPTAQHRQKELSLNLTEEKNAMSSNRIADRRKAISKAEKERRVDVHKLHLLCLLSHVERRNRWCNDPKVQDALRPLLTDKMTRMLNPRPTLIQFARTESLKKGIQETRDMFKTKFRITERGLRRALWPENEEQLKDYRPPEDTETTLEKTDFLEAAKSLQGSRDVGAQLFCALLRCAGVEARLVCSLQPLSCVPGGPTMSKPKTDTNSKPSRGEIYAAAVAKYESTSPASNSPLSSRRRLGHPLATAYHVPSIEPPPSRPPPSTQKRIAGESRYPVYWVEVLDVAHQKWHPVDPLVTATQWRPHALEPPASDTLNCLSYAVAFEADGTARDVTRRYAKAYNSKTKRQRIDGPNIPANRNPGVTPDGAPNPLNAGERWWRRAMRRYRRSLPTDLDQIEERELAAEEAKEPMPRNVSDFKDHPIYALERHLRRNEVLVPDAQPSGTVGAGSKGPLERIYRRRDVRIARSKERWYRLGRIVKTGEVAVKVLPKPARRKSQFGDEEEEELDDDPDRVGLFGDDAAGTPIYMLEQTELYRAPPVVGGRVPKNRFGNVDVHVPSMVPEGGVHIIHERAPLAAFILGVDYAPALTGFEFKGRKGTAVLNGVVVPKEAEEGVRAAIDGLSDLEAEMEEERRRRTALRMWSRFLKGLRIRERVYAGVDEEAEAEEEGKGKEIGSDSDTSELFLADDGEGGGFLIE